MCLSFSSYVRIYVQGIAVYTGKETKIQMNNRESRSKMSTLERNLNLAIIVIFFAQCILVLYICMDICIALITFVHFFLLMGILTVCMFGVVNVCIFCTFIYRCIYVSLNVCKCTVYVGELLGHQYIHHGFRQI